jgi:hypothetical protein
VIIGTGNLYLIVGSKEWQHTHMFSSFESVGCCRGENMSDVCRRILTVVRGQIRKLVVLCNNINNSVSII